jgi:hypothetical protein
MPGIGAAGCADIWVLVRRSDLQLAYALRADLVGAAALVQPHLQPANSLRGPLRFLHGNRRAICHQVGKDIRQAQRRQEILPGPALALFSHAAEAQHALGIEQRHQVVPQQFLAIFAGLPIEELLNDLVTEHLIPVNRIPADDIRDSFQRRAAQVDPAGLRGRWGGRWYLGLQLSQTRFKRRACGRVKIWWGVAISWGVM